MKDFDSEQHQRYQAEQDDPEERAFMLGGRKLYRRRHMPAGVLTTLAKITPDSPGQQDIAHMVNAIHMMIAPESAQDFEDAVLGRPYLIERDDGSNVEVTPDVPDVDTLSAAMQWLSEQGTGRPFGSSSAQPALSQTRAPGPPSRGGVLRTVEVPSPASTPEASSA